MPPRRTGLTNPPRCDRRGGSDRGVAAERVAPWGRPSCLAPLIEDSPGQAPLAGALPECHDRGLTGVAGSRGHTGSIGVGWISQMSDPVMSNASPSLRLEHISKRYGRKSVLHEVNHTFLRGLTLLTGPSGAGKSTLLRLCATAEKPSGGGLFWEGKALPGARGRLRQTLGYAPQAVDLPEDLTAREFGLHMAALKGLNARDADAQFRMLLDALNLGSDANGRISTFSGGMRRRLIFAQALLGSPRLLALDEPTAELDGESRERVGDLIGRAAQTAVVIMTSHLADAISGGGAVLRVEDGKLAPVTGTSA